METKQGQIHALIPKVMKEVGAIEKGRRNQQQGYSFRGIDDFYNALHNVLADNGVFFTPEVLEQTAIEGTTKNGGATINRTVKVRFTFYAPDGSSVQAVTLGEGTDMSDKAANKAQSAATKYCLLQVFCIPTEEMVDSENETPERPVARKELPPDDFSILIDEAFDAREHEMQQADPDFLFTPGDRRAICAGIAKKAKVNSLSDLVNDRRNELLRKITAGAFDKLRSGAPKQDASLASVG